MVLVSGPPAPREFEAVRVILYFPTLLGKQNFGFCKLLVSAAFPVPKLQDHCVGLPKLKSENCTHFPLQIKVLSPVKLEVGVLVGVPVISTSSIANAGLSPTSGLIKTKANFKEGWLSNTGNLIDSFCHIESLEYVLGVLIQVVPPSVL